MKYLNSSKILLLILVFSFEVHAEHNPYLVIPTSLTMGLCPRGYDKIPVTRSISVVMTNISDENITIVDSWAAPEYSTDKYGKYGSIFDFYAFPQIFYPPLIIYAKKSIQLSIRFNSFDTGDTGAVEFSTKIILLSRTSPEFPMLYKDLYRDTLYLRATSVDSQKILGSQLYYYGGRGCPKVYETPTKDQIPLEYYINFVNKLYESVQFDTIQAIVTGPSVPVKIYPVDINTFQETIFPITILPNNRQLMSVGFSPKPYGNNKISILGYFTGKDTKLHYTAEMILSNKDTLLPAGRFFLFSNYFQSNKGEEVLDKETVYLNACSNSPIWADSIVFTPAWSKDELKVVSGVVTFPFLMDPDEEYRLDLLYTPQERGRKFGFAKGYFHSTDGKPIVRTLDFQTYYAGSSSVDEDSEEHASITSLLITEPSFPIKLLGNFIGTLKLYDSFGNTIDGSTRLHGDILSLEGLSSGVYCFMVKTNSGIVCKKILYMR